jgi:hypothetical protein
MADETNTQETVEEPKQIVSPVRVIGGSHSENVATADKGLGQPGSGHHEKTVAQKVKHALG